MKLYPCRVFMRRAPVNSHSSPGDGASDFAVQSSPGRDHLPQSQPLIWLNDGGGQVHGTSTHCAQGAQVPSPTMPPKRSCGCSRRDVSSTNLRSPRFINN